MRNVLIVFSLVGLFMSCDQTAKYQAPIEQLAASWDSTTTTVQSFTEALQASQQEWHNTLPSLQLADDLKASLDESGQSQLTALHETFQGFTTAYEEVGQEVNTFIAQWQEQTAQLVALQEGLTSGQLPADAQEQINALTEAVPVAKANVADWTSRVETTKGFIADATQQYQDLTAAATMLATKKK